VVFWKHDDERDPGSAVRCRKPLYGFGTWGRLSTKRNHYEIPRVAIAAVASSSESISRWDELILRSPEANPILRATPRKPLQRLYLQCWRCVSLGAIRNVSLRGCYKEEVAAPFACSQPVETVGLGVGSQVTMRVPRSASHQARNPALSTATANPESASGLNAIGRR
jgi:hypothetical protein